MAGMIIPTKKLNDKYKLKDFQDDIQMLFNLYNRAVDIEIIQAESRIIVTGENNKKTIYRIDRENGRITNIYNETDDFSVKIKWR